jgi:hypothetical protein
MGDGVVVVVVLSLLTHYGVVLLWLWNTPLKGYLSIYLSSWAKYVVHMTCSWNWKRISCCCQ